MMAYVAATPIATGAANTAASRHRGLRSAKLSTINAVNPAASAASAISGFEINERPASDPARTAFGVAFRARAFGAPAFGAPLDVVHCRNQRTEREDQTVERRIGVWLNVVRS